jgi:hypothetical protein
MIGKDSDMMKWMILGNIILALALLLTLGVPQIPGIRADAPPSAPDRDPLEGNRFTGLFAAYAAGNGDFQHIRAGYLPQLNLWYVASLHTYDGRQATCHLGQYWRQTDQKGRVFTDGCSGPLSKFETISLRPVNASGGGSASRWEIYLGSEMVATITSGDNLSYVPTVTHMVENFSWEE